MTVWVVEVYDDCNENKWIHNTYGTEDAAKKGAAKERDDYFRDFRGGEDTGQDIGIRWEVTSYPLLVEEES